MARTSSAKASKNAVAPPSKGAAAPAKKAAGAARPAKKASSTAGPAASAAKKPAPKPKKPVKEPAAVMMPILPADDKSDKNSVHIAAGEGRAKYVYCVIQASEALKFGRIGIGPEASEVYTVNHRDLAAVVSDTQMVVHDPTRENVLTHQSVTETVMRQHTVIPMSFGTVFKTRDDIVELLRTAYDAFVDVSSKMQNKFELGLKVLWDREQMIHEIETQDEDVRRLKNEISAQKGSTYFARMQYGRLVDSALQARSERYVADIFANLRDVSIASRANKPIGDKMILNAAFLVARDREAGFDARLKKLGAQYDKLTFKYTGPWPPYNFVNIRLKLERAK
jgi:hypothetical protein